MIASPCLWGGGCGRLAGSPASSLRDALHPPCTRICGAKKGLIVNPRVRILVDVHPKPLSKLISVPTHGFNPKPCVNNLHSEQCRCRLWAANKRSMLLSHCAGRLSFPGAPPRGGPGLNVRMARRGPVREAQVQHLGKVSNPSAPTALSPGLVGAGIPAGRVSRAVGVP